MAALLICVVIFAIGWITIRSMNREKAKVDRVAATGLRISQTYDLSDLHVSRDGDSFIGLTPDGTSLAVGGDQGETLVPVADIAAIEGRRDGTVLVRLDRTGPPINARPVSSVAALPDRITSLSLRILTTGGTAFEVSFFDGGRHGVPPSNAAFRLAAVEVESWYRKLSSVV